jgi:hypothetical protein
MQQSYSSILRKHMSVEENNEKKTDSEVKPIKGRPKGSGSGNTKMLRSMITPRQAYMIEQIHKRIGGTESEHVRRALDAYFDKLVARGELLEATQADIERFLS